MNTILSVQNLNIFTESSEKKIKIVENVNFELKKGKTLALIGESGCGKSITANCILKLFSPFEKLQMDGKIIYENQNLLSLDEKTLQSIRGNEISMVFQDPLSALNPTIRIGNQIKEVMRAHQKISNFECEQRTLELLSQVGIHDPYLRMNQFPHEFSGGMRQRVMIAMAVACNPKILIADEPTTALDVTIQAQILNLLKQLQAKYGLSILLITHDFGVVAEMADFVHVMYAGKIIEKGTAEDIFYNPAHPYTKALLNAMPRHTNKKISVMKPIEGSAPPPEARPLGCIFHPRCPYAMNICAEKIPEEYHFDTQLHSACCHLWDPKAKQQLSIYKEG